MSTRIDQAKAPEDAKPWYAVVLTEARCVLTTLVMLVRGEIVMPRRNVGRMVRFSDETNSEVYRETAMRRREDDDLVLLAVRFRLRFIGGNRLGHFLFRVESLLNTLFFAAHPGFQTKLWLTDRRTGYYRGIYEWRGRTAAIDYLETLRVVLAPWVQTGTFAYEVIEGVSREEYLEGFLPEDGLDSHRAWWQPVSSGDDADRARD